MSVNSTSQNAMNVKLAELQAHRALKRARRFDMVAKGTVIFATNVVALAALGLGAWSNQTVAKYLGVPGIAGWAAALVIDGIWLVSLAIVQLHRKEPWRALSAYQATLWMVGLSALTNFAHGLIRFGGTWRGIMAGLGFALLPVALKWLVSVSTKNAMSTLLKAPDAKNRIKQAGQIQAEVALNEVLKPTMELLTDPEPTTTVELERVAENPKLSPKRWEQRKAELEASLPEAPKPEPAPAPVVPATPATVVPINDRKTRVNDLASKIAERGGALNSVTFAEIAEWYGVKAKATASNLRKDAHSAYLANAQTGQYL